MKFEQGAIGAIKRHNHRYAGSTLNGETVRENLKTRYMAVPMQTQYRKQILIMTHNKVDTREYSSASYFLLEHGKTDEWMIIDGNKLDREYRILSGTRGVLTVIKKR